MTQLVKRRRPSEKGVLKVKVEVVPATMACICCRIMPAPPPAPEEAKISKAMGIQCCEIYSSWRLVNQDAPLLLGGSGHII